MTVSGEARQLLKVIGGTASGAVLNRAWRRSCVCRPPDSEATLPKAPSSISGTYKTPSLGRTPAAYRREGVSYTRATCVTELGFPDGPSC